MSRKRAAFTALNDRFWNRVEEELTAKQWRYSDLWQIMVRDKNIYTSWKKRRTVLQISDVEEIAAALRVLAVRSVTPHCVGEFYFSVPTTRASV